MAQQTYNKVSSRSAQSTFGKAKACRWEAEGRRRARAVEIDVLPQRRDNLRWAFRRAFFRSGDNKLCQPFNIALRAVLGHGGGGNTRQNTDLISAVRHNRMRSSSGEAAAASVFTEDLLPKAQGVHSNVSHMGASVSRSQARSTASSSSVKARMALQAAPVLR